RAQGLGPAGTAGPRRGAGRVADGDRRAGRGHADPSADPVARGREAGLRRPRRARRLATASHTRLHVAAPWRRPRLKARMTAMLTLTGNTQESSEVWSARAVVRAEPSEVLAALTDPELIAAWAPVGFELEDPDAPPLHAGSHERVCGSLAGVK